MGLGFLPAFDPPLPSFRYSSDGCALLQFSDALDTLASQRGLRPFTTFADTRDVPETFTGDPSDLEEILGPWKDWFSPTDGIAVVTGLLAAIDRDDSSIGKNAADKAWVNSELDVLLEALQTASSAGSKFRLEVVS